MKPLIVGRGRLGRGLAGALRDAGVHASLTEGRAPLMDAVAQADVLVIATPDPAISEVATRLADQASGPMLHCSGSLGADVLSPYAPRGVMHPLVSFADPERPPTVAGTTFVIDGDPDATQAARAIAEAVGANAVVKPLHGPAYHAAAALSANGAAALATVAVRVLEAQGMDRCEAEAAVGALLRTVGENVERVGVPRSLSGPVMRGDHAAVAKHQAALDALDPAARAAYDAVAPAILDCARKAGLDEERAKRVEALLGE